MARGTTHHKHLHKMPHQETETFYPANPQEWRKWLQQNHDKKESVWLIYDKNASNKRPLTWSEAVDEALCFGWIDSKSKSIDEGTYMQFFSKRKPNGPWSKINKEKIEKLIEDEKMTQAGLDCIEKAKQNGSWTILDEVEELIVPQDLEKALDQYPEAKDYFLGLSKSVRKMMLTWVSFAKQAETRQKRINEIAICASEKRRPKQF